MDNSLNKNGENSDRKKAEEKLWQSEEKYYSLITNIPDITWTTDNKGNTIFISPNIEKVYGYTPEEIYEAGDSLWLGRIHPDDIEELKKSYEALFEKGDQFDVEYRIKRKDGRWIWLHDKSIVTYEKDGVMYADGIFSDITERKQAEEALRESEKKYKNLLNNIPGMVYSAKSDWSTEVIYNSENICGYSTEDFSSQKVNWLDIIHPDDKEKVVKEAAELEKKRTGTVQEYRIIDKSGNIRWVEDRKTSVFLREGVFEGIDGAVFDITEHKLAEEKLLGYQQRLQDLASEMSLTEERERKRIAVELHDQITQKLILFKLKIGMLQDSKLSPELIEPLDEMYKYLDNVIEEMRSLIFDVGSPTLYELGLEVAVREWLNEEIQKKHGIQVEFKSDGLPKVLDEDISALLYRSVRELLVNVVKHSQAQHVNISIRYVNGNIHVNVIDDGVGFQVPLEELGSNKTGGFGLFSIRERLRYFGGNIDIESESGHGTQVRLSVPIKYKGN